MEEKKKDLARFAINDDDLSAISGGNNLPQDDPNQPEYWFDVCPQCHHSVLCTPKDTLEDHMKKYCSCK